MPQQNNPALSCANKRVKQRVRRALFSDLNLSDPFFDSFREDYAGFDDWFMKKSSSGEFAFIVEGEVGLDGFVYVKTETEEYGQIEPCLTSNLKLKIGSFKLKSTGRRVGERFTRSIFDYARQIGCLSIYFTIFCKYSYVAEMFQKCGFKYHGTKQSQSGEELVFVKDLPPERRH